MLTASVGVCILRYHLLENKHIHDIYILFCPTESKMGYRVIDDIFVWSKAIHFVGTLTIQSKV